jgi:hypothetical protein
VRWYTKAADEGNVQAQSDLAALYHLGGQGVPQDEAAAVRWWKKAAEQGDVTAEGNLVEETRGTIFIMAHGRSAAFDKDDGQMMRVLADFGALAVRHKRQQQALLEQAKEAAAAAIANELANHISNPLQSLINIAHLAAEGYSDHNAKTLGQELSVDLRRLSALVTESLGLPGNDLS